MYIFENNFYTLLVKLSNLILLNLLWLLMCVPIITIFASTSAMFGVIHHWKTQNSNDIIKPFFTIFFSTFKQNLLMNIIGIGMYKLLDIYLLNGTNMPPAIKTISWMVIGITIVLSLSVLIYYFPMVVRFPKTKTMDLIINSIILSINQLPITLLVSAGILIGGLVISVLPILTLCLISVISYFVSFCSEKVFQKVITY